jgi:hypothetical protein
VSFKFVLLYLLDMDPAPFGLEFFTPKVDEIVILPILKVYIYSSINITVTAILITGTQATEISKRVFSDGKNLYKCVLLLDQ